MQTAAQHVKRPLLIPEPVMARMVQQQPHLSSLAKRATLWDEAARRLAQNYLRGMRTGLSEQEVKALEQVAKGGTWPLPHAEGGLS